jgi:putative ABC transport system permease protein
LFWQDVKYGVRMLKNKPGFALACILTLALGIGADSAMFSIVHATLLTSVPVPESDRVVMVWTDNTSGNAGGFPASGPDFLDWRASGIFEKLAGFVSDGYNLLVRGQPVRVPGVAVTREWFEILQVKAYLGRLFRPEDMRAGGGHVVVLSYPFWRSRFGGEEGIVGRTIALNGSPYTVIGVLPPRVVPLSGSAGEQLYVPLMFDSELATERGQRYIGTVGRLSPNLTFASAQRRMAALSMRLAKQYPKEDGGKIARLQPIEEAYVEDIRSLVLLLFGAVGFVLLVACANIASLLLVHGMGRKKEIAIRVALGAGRSRVLQQLLTESVLLGLGGGIVGILPAYFGMRLLARHMPGWLPNTELLGLDPTVLLFTLCLAIGTGVIFGILPACTVWQASGIPSLRSRSGISRREMRLGNLFVIAEVALTVVLLAGAALMLRTLRQLQDAYPGYSTNTFTLRVSLVGKEYDDPGKQALFCKELLRRISNLPGVVAAGAIDSLPTSNDLTGGVLYFTDRPQPKESDRAVVAIGSATPRYFQAMRIPLIRGRLFSDADGRKAPLVVLLDQRTARRYWPHEDPIGRYIRLGLRGPLVRIVGIVGSVDRSVAIKVKSPIGQVYVPFDQSPVPDLSLAISSYLDKASLFAAVNRIVRVLAPDAPVYQMETMAEARAAGQIASRFFAWLLGFFASVSLLLAAIGIYAVIAYTVEKRRREIGVRMALGATPSKMLADTLKTGTALTSAGVISGLAGAFALTRTIRSMLYGVSPNDPISFLAAVGLLVVVGLVACGIPAYRASCVDPAIVLREE